MGRMPQPEAVHHPAFAVVMRLVDGGQAWVKLSGPYLDTREGAPRYGDVKPVARAFAGRAPERCVWGSDWPHPMEQAKQLPDDALLFDLLQEWAPDEHTRMRILVDNREPTDSDRRSMRRCERPRRRAHRCRARAGAAYPAAGAIPSPSGPDRD